jgi:hypothetical protein
MIDTVAKEFGELNVRNEIINGTCGYRTDNTR